MSYKTNVIDGFFGVMYFGFNEVKKGNGLPTLSISRPWHYADWEKLKNVVDNDKWICPIILEEIDDSYYTISKAEIHTPNQKCYKFEYAYLSEALHNMAHSWQAQERLSGQFDYAKEELYAEMVKFAILYYLGGFFPKHKDDSCAYFRAWGQLDEEEYQEIVREARTTTYGILTTLNIV